MVAKVDSFIIGQAMVETKEDSIFLLAFFACKDFLIALLILVIEASSETLIEVSLFKIEVDIPYKIS